MLGMNSYSLHIMFTYRILKLLFNMNKNDDTFASLSYFFCCVIA